jgi:mono/diheme cytochrome c family protein
MRFALPIIAAAAAALLGACQTVSPQPTPDGTSVTAIDARSPEARGYKLARNRCADCHSIDYGETSPVPDAPSFSAIASTSGLTAETLAQWLKDHRNYPDEMYFEIPAEHVEDLTAYMLTLRRPAS